MFTDTSVLSIRSHVLDFNQRVGEAPTKAPGEHAHEHGDSLINVVIHPDFVFVVMKPMQVFKALLVPTQDTGMARRSVPGIPSPLYQHTLSEVVNQCRTYGGSVETTRFSTETLARRPKDACAARANSVES